MKRPLALAVVAATWLAAPALAQTMPPPAISVTGEANVSVAPDQAQIDGGVTSDAKTAREASDANNAAMGKVLLALKGAGIDEKDYQTSRLSLQPQFTRRRPKPSERAAGIVSFRASNRVTVKIRDVTKVANVIDVLVGRRRQRHRRHQFHGNAGLKTSGRSPREGDRGCAPQGGDLRQGRRRDARRADQHFRGRRARAVISRQDGRADGRRRTGGAGRRDAFGDGERVLGDQGRRSNARHCERSEAIHASTRRIDGLLRRFAPCANLRVVAGNDS